MRGETIRGLIIGGLLVLALVAYAFLRAPGLPSDYDAMEPVYPAGSRVLVNVRASSFAVGDDVYYEYGSLMGDPVAAKQLGRIEYGPGDAVPLDRSNKDAWPRFEKSVDERGRAVGVLRPDEFYVLRLNDQPADGERPFYDSRSFGPVSREHLIGKVVGTFPF